MLVLVAASYIYWNRADSQWWIDGPDGLGVYVVQHLEAAATGHPSLPLPAQGWKVLGNNPDYFPLPQVSTEATP